jgi:lipopolysaccharide assembly protein A
VSTQPQTPAPGPPLDTPQEPEHQKIGHHKIEHHKIRHTRISGLWFAVAFFAVVLLFLLIFIVQNDRAVDISYLGMHGHLQLGVALLLSAVCGALLTILAGAARISQLHAVARRHRRADARGATARPAGDSGATANHEDARAANAPADPGR